MTKKVEERRIWPGRLRLGTQLLGLLALISLLPLMVVTLVGYLSSRQDIERLTTQALQNSAQAMALQVEFFVEEKRKLVPSLVAGNQYLRQVVTQALNEGWRRSYTPGLSPLDLHLQAKAAQSQHLAEYYVLSPQGELLGSSDSMPPRGIYRFDSCLLNHAPGEGAALLERGARRATYLVSYPIYDSYGVVLGIFCGRYRVDLKERLPRWSSEELEATQFWLVDEAGEPLWSSAEARGHKEVLSRVEGQRNWQGSHGGEAGSVQLAAVAAVGDSPFYIVAEIPSQVAFRSLNRLRRRALGLGGAFVAFVLMGMVVATRRMVRPIEDLVAATESMGAGQLAQAVKVGGPQEIARLGEVFNRMSQEVSSLHESLEERVAARTKELHDEQAFTELVFDSMDESLLVIDSDFVVLKANKAAQKTFRSNLEGRTCYQEFQGREHPCRGCPVPLALQNREEFSTEQAFFCTKEPEVISFRGFPLPGDSNGNGGRMLLVSRIITEELQREQQMMHHEKMAAFALLAAGTAHEMGNPLASIKAQVDLSLQLGEDSQMVETLEVVGKEVRRMERLLREMAGFARRRSHRGSLVSLNHIVDDAVRLMTHDPRSKHVHITTVQEADLPAVEADEEQVLQVLLNLGLNGIDAASTGGSLLIETRYEEDKGEVEVWVSNSGPLIPEEIRDRIFEPYFTTKEEGKGTGLGLFVSRRLMEGMGGTLRLADDDLRGQTTFILTLNGEYREVCESEF